MCRFTLLAFLCVGAAAAAAQVTDGASLGVSVGDDTRPTATTDLVPETAATEPEQATPVAAAAATATEPTPSPRGSTGRPAAAPSPPIVSKLGYFSRARAGSSGGVPGNSVERPDGDGKRRRFKSRCRCEKIWNCPKLQITVPRCPDEYFLCCF